MLHQGIAVRNFKQTFNLADHVKVVGATLENGLLWIDLVREVPEQLKPRRIEVGVQGDGSRGKTISRSRSTRAANAEQGRVTAANLKHCGPSLPACAGRLLDCGERR